MHWSGLDESLLQFAKRWKERLVLRSSLDFAHKRNRIAPGTSDNFLDHNLSSIDFRRPSMCQNTRSMQQGAGHPLQTSQLIERLKRFDEQTRKSGIEVSEKLLQARSGEAPCTAPLSKIQAVTFNNFKHLENALNRKRKSLP